ncbi:MAG: hypothetical protein RQ739_09875 [Desulfotignum sp.]|nr:hypothetical protein [Desulfotignum sp.]
MKTDPAELDSGLSPPVKPYAFDRDLLEQVRHTGYAGISIYPFAFPAVVAGRGTDLETEIRINRCVQDRIPVFRRRGGGCSVFLDPGTLIVSMALPAEGFSGIQRLFNLCNRHLIQALEAFGLDGIYQDGISDLVLADRKVGGSSFFRSRNLAYYSASLLVSTNLDAMDQYLYHPPREPAFRKHRPHREFVMRLDTAFPGLTPEVLADRLRHHFAVTFL